MPIVQLASFPNSRVKPRPVRTTGDTQIIQVLASSTTQILAANPNRVDVLVRNLDSTNSIYYGYDASIDGSVGPNGGFRLDAGQTVKIDDPRAIFIFNGNAVAINIDIDEGEG